MGDGAAHWGHALSAGALSGAATLSSIGAVSGALVAWFRGSALSAIGTRLSLGLRTALSFFLLLLIELLARLSFLLAGLSIDLAVLCRWLSWS